MNEESRTAEELEQFLVDQGYRRLGQRSSPEAFNDQQISFAKAEFLVQLIRDRLQWFVDFGTQATSLFNVEVWMGVIGGVSLGAPATSFEDQTNFIRLHLKEMEDRTLADGPVLATRLDEWRASRSVARRGQAGGSE